MSKKLFLCFVFICALANLFSVGVLADAQEHEESVDLKVEFIKETDELSEELRKQVEEDIKNNPDKVEMATPISEVQLFSSPTPMPFSFTFNFQNSLSSRELSNLKSNTSAALTVDKTPANDVNMSLYKKNSNGSWTFLGTRTFPQGKTSLGNWSSHGPGVFYFILTHAEPANGWHATGSGNISGY